MDYKKLYFKIIEKSLTRPITGYTETHHIIPRSLGGTDDTTNLVKLTAREHFLCHYLLAKMHPMFSESWFKMNNAFIMMRTNPYGHRYVNSRLYDSLKKNFSLVMSVNQAGNKNSNYGTIWIYNESLRTNKKIKKDSTIPDGWSLGRKFIWGDQMTVCECCGFEFVKAQKRFCSDICRHSAVKDKIDNNDDLILEIAKRYVIIYTSVSKNSDFILELVNSKIPRNRILKFLKCNSSGPNYKSFNKICARSSIV